MLFDGSEPIADARHAARRFMTDVEAVHGLHVSDRATGVVELVVSELVTNAFKYAPGPCQLDLEVSDDAVAISVWDTDPTLPRACRADPGRVGRHGLEVARAVCRSLEISHEPVGKRVTAAVVLADDPGKPPPGQK
ncbi:ATP-binding protein [Streptomyces sp. NPDC057099]|uniref:ATP-binding protein n=1 Tax=Streptomyces sp. NPDC057099 TaxID=3346019 RepID=UPI00363C68B9